jgi:hypothetical protein
VLTFHHLDGPCLRRQHLSRRPCTVELLRQSCAAVAHNGERLEKELVGRRMGGGGCAAVEGNARVLGAWVASGWRHVLQCVDLASASSFEIRELLLRGLELRIEQGVAILECLFSGLEQRFHVRQLLGERGHVLCLHIKVARMAKHAHSERGDCETASGLAQGVCELEPWVRTCSGSPALLADSGVGTAPTATSTAKLDKQRKPIAAFPGFSPPAIFGCLHHRFVHPPRESTFCSSVHISHGTVHMEFISSDE